VPFKPWCPSYAKENFVTDGDYTSKPETPTILLPARELRPYQVTAVEAVDRRLVASGPAARGYVESPTGSGKTAIAGGLAGRSHTRHPQAPILFLGHRRELIYQQAAELERWSGLRASILMAGEKFDPGAAIIVASVQTLAAREAELNFKPGLILYDEAHHLFTGSMIDPYLQSLSDVPVVGFSATPRRSWERPKPLLTECIFARGLTELIAENWLAPLRSERIEAPMNLAEIGSHNGDYAEPVLAVQALRADVIAAIVDAAVPRLRERPEPALCFAVSVKHAQRLAAAFDDAGISTVVMWGEQPTGEREAAFMAWQAGDAQLLVNCNIASEGIDLPALLTIIVARPTRSRRLYQQIVGRGTRKAPGKEFCLVLEACAVERDPGQVTLSAIVPEIDPESHRPGPPMLHLLDPDAADKWTWQFHAASGAYSVSADAGVTVYLIPEPNGSGLYRAVLNRRDQPYESLTGSLARDEAMHRAGAWLATNASLQLAASTRWYSKPVTPKQVEFVTREGIDATKLTCGAATKLISDRVASWVVPRIVRQLWPAATTTELSGDFI
jgi:superfamily II DNA or RNA helicase